MDAQTVDTQPTRVANTAIVQPQQQSLVYIGQAQTIAQFPDIYGFPIQRSYAIPVAITIGPPLILADGQRETNQFNFRVDPAPGTSTMQEGLYSLVSAAVSFLTGPLLVQYWDFRLDGTALSGQLTNPQNGLSLTTNLINLPIVFLYGIEFPFVWGMATGTNLVGTANTEQVAFHLEGNDIGLMHPFVSDVVANRVI